MAASQAKKKRLKAVSSGKLDPAIHRNGWQGVKPVTRRTPTLQETINKNNKKHNKKWSRVGYNEDSTFLLRLG
ncbi:hypothetical protein K0T92_05945 [Paenibacillus oenotherae]|uniref:Uncharacterized protein n=1 Tax=Paenibacillus oenotherae TaxID=1435645 RepID=A0ABS7D350_9BACL|nr:hypothetical protein [Paenibacillus oenotherae]MBW7474279.1 hypothetical protein [Paenibacillus oenotherae]